jgi:hypothetical protein
MPTACVRSRAGRVRNACDTRRLIYLIVGSESCKKVKMSVKAVRSIKIGRIIASTSLQIRESTMELDITPTLQSLARVVSSSKTSIEQYPFQGGMLPLGLRIAQRLLGWLRTIIPTLVKRTC